METEEKYDNSNCPDGFCKADYRGYGGCLDENVRTQEAALARLSGLSLEQLVEESKKVQERTNRLIKAAAQREAINEESLLALKEYMTHGELEKEVQHMYERNELALQLYSFVEAGTNYLDKLVTEVAVGSRGKKSGSEEAIVMNQN